MLCSISKCSQPKDCGTVVNCMTDFKKMISVTKKACISVAAYNG